VWCGVIQRGREGGGEGVRGSVWKSGLVTGKRP